MISFTKKVFVLTVCFFVIILAYNLYKQSQVPPSDTISIPKSDIQNFLAEEYGTDINSEYFTHVNTLFCRITAPSQYINNDCAGRKGDVVFTLGHANQTDDKDELNKNMVLFLMENNIFPANGSYTTTCAYNTEVDQENSTLLDCEVASISTSTPAVFTMSIFYFNTDKEVFNYLMTSPKIGVEEFMKMSPKTIVPVEEEVSFRFINIAYAEPGEGEGGTSGGFGGGFSGGGYGNESGDGRAGGSGSGDGTSSGGGGGYSPSQASTQAAVQAMGLESASGYTNPGQPSPGMVQTGPNSFCCNSFGDAVSPSSGGGGGNSGSGGGWSAGPGGSVVYIPPPPPPVSGRCSGVYNCSQGNLASQGNNGSQYTWRCNGSNGGSSASCSAWIPPAISISASPNPVGHSANNGPANPRISWSVTNASNCTAGGGWSGDKNSSAGSQIMTQSISTNYALTCSGNGGTRSNSVVALMPSGYITASNCEIVPESPSCNSTVMWQASNFIGSPAVTRPPSGTLSSAVSGPRPFPMNPDSFVFRLDDTGSGFFRSATPSVWCNPLSVWQAGLCRTLPVVTVIASPNLIRSGEVATVNVTVQSIYDLVCTFRDGGAPQTFTHTGPGTVTYPYNTRALTSAQIVTVECTSPTYNLVTDTNEARVNVVPTVQEI